MTTKYLVWDTSECNSPDAFSSLEDVRKFIEGNFGLEDIPTIVIYEVKKKLELKVSIG